MKKSVDSMAAASKAVAPRTYKYFTGFDGVTMKTLNPPETLKLMKPAGAKGSICFIAWLLFQKSQG